MQPIWTERKQATPIRREGDHRSPYQRDKARILHSAAFRRLQAKTQVLGVGISDFHRTRLTHSLEASQIGQGIAAQISSKYPQLATDLELNEHLIEALCLAHDIGHPPYGHGGEVALHYMMRDHGGFEGNGQTFRIVTRLEPYTPDFGMNLCRRTVLGLVKYPQFIDTLTNPAVTDTPQLQQNATTRLQTAKWHPPKALYRCDEAVFDWLLAPLSESDTSQFMAFSTAPQKHGKTRFKSFDCSIMELADDIAYGIHDLEDAIVMGIVNQAQFIQEVVLPINHIDSFWLADNISSLSDKLFSEHHHERKDAIGALVNAFITAIEVTETDATFENGLLRHNASLPEEYARALDVFKQFVLKRVIKKPEMQQLEFKGQQIVMELFEAFASEPERLLPHNTRQRWELAAKNNNGMRVIADYISGMTDDFAARLYANLFLPDTNPYTGVI